jgi:hypothetical protein
VLASSPADDQNSGPQPGASASGASTAAHLGFALTGSASEAARLGFASLRLTAPW